MGFGFDVGAAATNLSTKVNKTLSSSSLAQGLSSAGDTLKNAIGSIGQGIEKTFSNITGAIPGLSTAETAIQNAKKNVDNFGNLFENATKKLTIESLGIPPGERLPNVLSYYSSVNYLFTLSVLDDVSINFPNETYRKGVIGPLMLKSGNGSPMDRIPLSYKPPYNKQGGYDFFIENLEVRGIIGFEKTTGNTNSTGISFKVVEPYSMGLFFESLQTAALTAGHKNYLDVPLLLTIEFKGHLDANTQNAQIDKTTKYIPLKLMTVQMKVTGKGSEYDIKAYPWNEKAYSTIYSQLKTDISIQGQSVIEMLQTGENSLQRILNDRLAEAVKRKDVNVPDQILISFPNDLKTGDYAPPPTLDQATVNPNQAPVVGDFFAKLGLTTSKGQLNKTQIQVDGTVNDVGKSTMGFNLYNRGDTPFAKDNLTYDEQTGIYKRGNVQIKPSDGVFKFAQGTDVINAINQVIIMSEYGRTALQQLSKEGNIQWWRIETHLYNIPTDANIAKTGVKPKLIMYRVVPYSVNASAFMPVNQGLPGTKEAKLKVLKEYNYIYTGKNTDIIDWDIDFKAGFYKSLSADSGRNNAGLETKKNTGGAAESADDPSNASAPGKAPGPNSIPQAQVKDGVLTQTAYKGGGGIDDNASIASRQLHDVITSGVDMIGLNLTILGDPYFIGDSGMGNYSAVSTDNPHITADGSMNYQNGEVHVIVNFRSPVDIDISTGMYDLATTSSISKFSGIYRVLRVESFFQRGRFTQSLKMVRLMGQEIPAPTKPSLTFTPGNPFVGPTVISDDGSTLTTYDDGSTLAVGTDGSRTSTPATDRDVLPGGTI